MSLAPEIAKQLADQKAAGLPEFWEVPVSVSRELSQSWIAFAGKPEPHAMPRLPCRLAQTSLRRTFAVLREAPCPVH